MAEDTFRTRHRGNREGRDPRVRASSGAGGALQRTTPRAAAAAPDDQLAAVPEEESAADILAGFDDPEEEEEVDDDNLDLVEATRRDRAARTRTTKRDAETQADTGPEWTQWDLGKALQALRSANPGVIQRTVRKLHVRLWHAPAQRLRDLLSAAGLPAHVVKAAQDVVDTCRGCREWQRRGRKPMTSLSFTIYFNEGVQFDLLFMDDGVVAHLVCMCIRFAQGEFVASKEPAAILDALSHFWIRTFGAPKFIVSDQEGALFSDEGGIWADRHGIDLRPKPKGAHAQIIERRNDLLRQQYNRNRTQANEEGLNISKTALLD